MIDINLREELDALLDEYGHYVLLQRSSRRLRCRCWHEVRREGDPNCPYCLGRGRVSRIERHKVRYSSGLSTIQRPMATTLSPVGPSWVDGKLFYFKHNVEVQTGDFIYEVGWSAKNKKKPTHLISAYLINDVYEYRGDNGRIEYKLASVRKETRNVTVKNIVLRALGPIENYEIIS